MTTKHFEDFAVGDIWESRPHRMEEAEMQAFARTYDPQPMHTDPEAARTGPHGAIIASGWQVAALSLKLFVESGGYGDTPVFGLGTDELRWTKPVRAGDVLRFRRETVELRRSKSNPTRGIVRTRISAVNQDGDEVMSMVSTGMIAARTTG